MVPLKTQTNLVDAAIAPIDPDIGFDATTLRDIGTISGWREDPVEPGDAVAKIVRTTGATRGLVTAVELDDVVVDYERGQLSFDRQIEGTGDSAFSAGGDSGSLIVDESDRAYALLFAGNDTGGSNGKGLTYANEIAAVFEQLDLDLALAPGSP